jgi:hypothetical protein
VALAVGVEVDEVVTSDVADEEVVSAEGVPSAVLHTD